MGISIVKPGEGNLEDAMLEASKYDSSILIEAFVPGRELTVSIGEEVFHPIHIRPAGEFYDFDSKYSDTGTEYIKADLAPDKLDENKKLCHACFQVIRM